MKRALTARRLAASDNVTTSKPPAAPSTPDSSADYQRRLSEAFTDDITWLSMGKGLLEQSIPTLNEQAKAIGKSIGWFWTIYSSTLLLTSLTGSLALKPETLILISPIFTTLLAYTLALFAQNPVLETIDLRSVQEIQGTVERLIRRKSRLIQLCVATLAITALLIGVGIAFTLV